MATATAPLGTIRKVFDRVRDSAPGGDGELLTRYRTLRDQNAFGSLVRRHGPMVLGVCRRVLRDHHAADDAFQATFLVLAKKADCVCPPDRLAPWLYGVAYRTALKSRGRAFRRRQVEHEYATDLASRGTSVPRSDTGHDASDLLPIIDEQLNALPEKYRAALVLCGVQGLNKAEAAAKLGLPEGTVSSRLARAREMLRDRLTRRGVVVPALAFAAILTPDALQAAVHPTLTATTSALALGSAATPATVLLLSHEVIRSMTLLKLNFLTVIALSVTLAGGGFGLYTLQADDKKPVGEKPAVAKPGEKPVKPGTPDGEKPTGDKPKPEKPDGDKAKPQKPGTPDGEKPAKPDGEKPGKKVRKLTGQIGAVDAAGRTVTVLRMGEGGLREDALKIAADAKVTVDGKDAKLDALPKGTTAEFVIASFGKDGTPPEASEISVDGSKLVWVVKDADATSVTLLGGGRESKLPDRVVKLAADAKVILDGKPAKPTDLQPGDMATVVLNADRSAATLVTVGTKGAGDGEKPGKPAAKRAFGGRVAEVDATARTITLAAKGEGGKAMVVRVTADAKISIDGKDAKLADVAKGAAVTFNLASAKDGQLREVDEVTVAGATFFGTVKQIDATTITVGNEKIDRVLKLAEGGKVMIGEKEGKFADLKVGDRVNVTMNSDESAAVRIVSGVKKPAGDKPRPDKEEDEPNDDQ